jgi:hypothetical protein
MKRDRGGLREDDLEALGAQSPDATAIEATREVHGACREERTRRRELRDNQDGQRPRRAAGGALPERVPEGEVEPLAVVSIRCGWTLVSSPE